MSTLVVCWQSMKTWGSSMSPCRDVLPDTRSPLSVGFSWESPGKSTQSYLNWCKEIEVGNKGLRPRVLHGYPLHLLFGEAQRRPLLVPLQYSYYRYLNENVRCGLVDAAVLAALLINIDMWQEKLSAAGEFNELVVNPLASGEDIRSLFP